MTRHAFVDESIRGQDYLICAATISPIDLAAARRELRSLRAAGQRRIHFATESNQRRRSVLKAMSSLETASVIYVARHPDQVAARAAILARMATDLRKLGVSRLTLETREGQDHRDRAGLYRVLGPSPKPPFTYGHDQPASEPLLWVPDAVAWAWGRGGHWRANLKELGLVTAVQPVDVA